MVTTKPMPTEVLEIIIKQDLDKNIDFIELPKFKKLLPKLTDEQKEMVYKMYAEHFYDIEKIHVSTFIRYKKLNDEWTIVNANGEFAPKNKEGQPFLKMRIPDELYYSNLIKDVKTTKKNIHGKLGGASKCPKCSTFHLEDKLKEIGVCPECKKTYKCPICNTLSKIESTQCPKCKISFSWETKGNLLKGLGEYKKAIECYNKILEYDYRGFSVWSSKGNCLASLGKHKEAIECFDIVLHNPPVIDSCAPVWFNKGKSLEQLGKIQDALECYRNAFKEDNYDKDYQHTLKEFRYKHNLNDPVQILDDISTDELYKTFKYPKYNLKIAKLNAKEFYQNLAEEIKNRVKNDNIYKSFKNFIENMNESSAVDVVKDTLEAGPDQETFKMVCTAPLWYLLYEGRVVQCKENIIEKIFKRVSITEYALYKHDKEMKKILQLYLGKRLYKKYLKYT